jgi:hypothetical protein
MIGLLACCESLLTTSWLAFLTRPLLAGLSQCKERSVKHIDAPLLTFVCFFHQAESDAVKLTDAIYTTRQQMSSQNIGKDMK